MSAIDDLMTLEDFAKLMRVDARTVQRWEARRIGPPRIKLGKRVYYRESAVRDWILSHERGQVRAEG